MVRLKLGISNINNMMLYRVRVIILFINLICLISFSKTSHYGFELHTSGIPANEAVE